MRTALTLVLLLFTPFAHAGLIERMIGTQEPKVAIHQFMAALGEWERGKITRAQVISTFSVVQAEEADLDALFTKMIPTPDSYALGAYNVLTNVGSAYDAIAPAKGLGLIRLEGSGVTGIEFTVRHNKVGTGTISYQLWDETTASEITVINDAAAAGDNKTGQVSVGLSGVAPGLHTIRVRAKSTVATDDPVYYGATIRVRRVDVMWSEVLHEVLLLSEYGVPGYSNAATLRARLGLP